MTRKRLLVLLPSFQHIHLVMLTCRQDQNSTRASVRDHTFRGRQLCRLLSVYSCSGRFETEAIEVRNFGCVASCAGVIPVTGDVVALPVLKHVTKTLRFRFRLWNFSVPPGVAMRSSNLEPEPTTWSAFPVHLPLLPLPLSAFSLLPLPFPALLLLAPFCAAATSWRANGPPYGLLPLPALLIARCGGGQDLVFLSSSATFFSRAAVFCWSALLCCLPPRVTESRLSFCVGVGIRGSESFQVSLLGAEPQCFFSELVFVFEAVCPSRCGPDFSVDVSWESEVVRVQQFFQKLRPRVLSQVCVHFPHRLA